MTTAKHNVLQKLNVAFELLKNEINSSDKYANENDLINNITKLVEKSELPDAEEINNLLNIIDNNQHNGLISNTKTILEKAKNLIVNNENWVNTRC